MDTKDYSGICQECGGNVGFVIYDGIGVIKIELCGGCRTGPEAEDEIGGFTAHF